MICRIGTTWGELGLYPPLPLAGLWASAQTFVHLVHHHIFRWWFFREWPSRTPATHLIYFNYTGIIQADEPRPRNTSWRLRRPVGGTWALPRNKSERPHAPPRSAGRLAPEPSDPTREYVPVAPRLLHSVGTRRDAHQVAGPYLGNVRAAPTTSPGRGAGPASEYFRAALHPTPLARRPKPAPRPNEPPRRGRPRAGDAGLKQRRASPLRHTAPGAPGTALPPQKGRTATL